MLKILYICTHNRCRSILSEAITNQLGKGRIEARSAGSQPCGEVHPLSIKYLQQAGVPTEGLRSQSWDEFENYQPDISITVCDSAANESCPLWLGQGLKMHWGLVDPSKLTGTDAHIEQAFNECIKHIHDRVERLLALPIENIKKADLKQALQKLGAQS